MSYDYHEKGVSMRYMDYLVTGFDLSMTIL